MTESKTSLKYHVNKKCLTCAKSSIDSDKLGSPAVIKPVKLPDLLFASRYHALTLALPRFIQRKY